MQHVMMVTRDFPPRINGGISTAVGGLVRALVSVGVRCSVLSFDGYRPNKKPNHPESARRDDQREIEVLRIVAPSQLPEAEAFCARADILHVHHAMLWDLVERVANGRPTVLTVHVAQAVMRQLRKLEQPTASETAQQRAIAGASCVTIPSAAVPIEGARVVSLGADPIAEPAAAPERATALYVGRFGDVKGTLQWLEAIPHIARRLGSALRVVVAGGLPDNRKADARWRRRFAEHAPSAELVGWLDPPALNAAYREASFVVVPSWYETFGQVILEAMQHGVPSIASNVGGAPALVGDAGVLVPPRDVPALCDAVVSLAQDVPRLRRLRESAAQRASSWHWRCRVGEWVTLYEELS
jgi:glycosyltransferase involved in cell wall biosynthesis